MGRPIYRESILGTITFQSSTTKVCFPATLQTEEWLSSIWVLVHKGWNAHMHKINICPAWMTEFLILRLVQQNCTAFNTRSDSFYNLYINNIRGYFLVDWLVGADNASDQNCPDNECNQLRGTARWKTKDGRMRAINWFDFGGRRRSQPGWAIQFYHNCNCKEFEFSSTATWLLQLHSSSWRAGQWKSQTRSNVRLNESWIIHWP